MEKGLSQLEYDHIDLILQEAEHHNVKELVQLWATMITASTNSMNLLEAYQEAYSMIMNNEKDRK